MTANRAFNDIPMFKVPETIINGKRPPLPPGGNAHFKK